MSGDRGTPLLDLHRRLGAKLTPFGGWEMPLQYAGVLAEHSAVRNRAGLFDVSHLGKLRVSGPEAGERLQLAVTADVLALEVGRAKYALVLTDDAGVVDDVFVYRIDDGEWLVVPNASNVAAVAERIDGGGVELVDEWDRYAILALQGPDAYDVFDATYPDNDARSLKLHRWMSFGFEGEPGVVARTGYTGERGYELYVPADAAETVFQKLLDRGAEPVGLGARDTLRLEMGYALYGHELTLDINPLEAGLEWAISWGAPFRGRDALEKVKSEGPRRRSFGVVCRARGVPRQGYDVIAGDERVGEITSGNHSPTLGTGIALALGPVAAVPDEGAEVAIDARGRRIAGDIVKPPFVGKR